MKDRMEFLVAIVRFFFCGLNMVSSISIYRTSAFYLLLVIIVNVNIMSTVLQVLFDYFISHLTCPPTCHQARNNLNNFQNFSYSSLCCGRATGRAASRGAVGAKSSAGSNPSPPPP